MTQHDDIRDVDNDIDKIESDNEIVADDLLIGRPIRSDDEQRSSISGTTSRAPLQPPPQAGVSLDLVFEKIIKIIVPVTLCALYSCLLVRILSWSLATNRNLLDRTWKRFGVDISLGGGGESTPSFSDNLTIVIIFCLLIVGITLIILLIFYLEWHHCLSYYFYLPSLIIMTIVTPAFMREIFTTLNWFALDLFTLIILLWNFTILGMVSIFGIGRLRAPLVCQQFYLIHNSAMMALLIIHMLPGWAPWLLLVFLVLWDLFAVLAPMGPLNLIINMAEREGIVDMPGLIYSTDMLPVLSSPPLEQQQQQHVRQNRSLSDDKMFGCSQVQVDTIDSDSGQGAPSEGVADDAQVNSDKNPRETVQDQASGKGLDGGKSPPSNSSSGRGQLGLDEKGVSIGLGDFIFYSLLISLTAKGRQLEDFYAILATLNAVLVGLVLTLATLALCRHALPALPISIGLGILIASLTLNLAGNLGNRFASEAIFI